MLVATSSGMAAPAVQMPTVQATPLVIAHRGASGERPEHTLAAYGRAIDEGADFIEPDLVVTRDGVLVVRHENEIGTTTDVAEHPEFRARRTVRTIDGQRVEGWFMEDFTLAEMRTLRAKERLPDLRPDNARYDGLFPLVTFDEVARYARARSKEVGRPIGVYPEMKHPAYFRSIGLPLEERMAAALTAQGWTGPEAPVLVQSFDPDSLKRLHRLVGVRLIQLIGEGAQGRAATSPAGLKAMAAYAYGVGPDLSLLFAPVAPDAAAPSAPASADGAGAAALPAGSGLVEAAHAAGLRVHPWTLRAENRFLPRAFRRPTAPDGRGDFAAWVRVVAATGVDGFFSDFPGLARQALTPPPLPPMPAAARP